MIAETCTPTGSQHDMHRRRNATRRVREGTHVMSSYKATSKSQHYNATFPKAGRTADEREKEVGLELYEAAGNGDVMAALRAIAVGAKLNWVGP